MSALTLRSIAPLALAILVGGLLLVPGIAAPENPVTGVVDTQKQTRQDGRAEQALRELEAAQQNLTEASRRIANAQAAIADLMAQLTEQHELRAQLEARLVELDRQLAEARSAADRARNAQAQLANLQTRYDALLAEFESLRASVEAQLAELRAQHEAQMAAARAECDRTIAELRAQIAAQQETIRDLRARLPIPSLTVLVWATQTSQDGTVRTIDAAGPRAAIQAGLADIEVEFEIVAAGEAYRAQTYEQVSNLDDNSLAALVGGRADWILLVHLESRFINRMGPYFNYRTSYDAQLRDVADGQFSGSFANLEGLRGQHGNENSAANASREFALNELIAAVVAHFND